MTIRQQKHSVQRTRSALDRDRATLLAAQEDIKARHQAQSTEAETTLAILRQLEWARRESRRHLYLGYWIAGHAKMHYKRRFGPLELFDGRRWVLAPEEMRKRAP